MTTGPSRPARRRVSSARWPTAPTRSRSARPTAPATSTRRPATRTFTVDTVAPDTTITGGPTGPRAATHRRSRSPPPSRARRSSASWTTPAGAGTYAACTSPQRVHDDSPTAPTRSRSARSTRRATSTARRRRATFTVDTAAPDTTITAVRPARRTRTAPSFAFTSSESGSTFECKLDTRRVARAPTYGCTSPQRLHDDSPTARTPSRCRATDGAGNVDAHAGDAHVHGRHGRSGHHDHRWPER